MESFGMKCVPLTVGGTGLSGISAQVSEPQHCKADIRGFLEGENGTRSRHLDFAEAADVK